LPASSANLAALTRADFATVAALARAIWLAHYTTIISKQQIDYMLEGRFTDENLARYLDAPDRWMWVLRVDGVAVGYASCALTATPREMKLEQLYLLPALHGRGLGKLMMTWVEEQARARGCDTLMLQVNKQNTTASRVYFAAGFTVRAEAVFDIGNGYVMDDYILEKALAPGGAPAASIGAI
jgi:ribosomal protein S18 acetylase RimI-like enzyme